MAIVCDKCRKEIVDVNGLTCEKCLDLEKYPNIDDRINPTSTIYLEPDLFKRFQELKNKADKEELSQKKHKTVFGKFMNTLKSSFIDITNGKEINDPTPQVIIPKHNTFDRIQKILDHNINAYAEQNEMETIESLNDFTVDDIMSDAFEESILQIVDNIELMEEETPPEMDEIIEETPPEKGVDSEE